MVQKKINFKQEHKSVTYNNYIAFLVAFIWVCGIFTYIYIDGSEMRSTFSTLEHLFYLLAWIVVSLFILILTFRTFYYNTYKYVIYEKEFRVTKFFKSYSIKYSEIDKLTFHSFDYKNNFPNHIPKRPMIKIEIFASETKLSFIVLKYSKDYDNLFYFLRSQVPKDKIIKTQKTRCK